MSELSEDDARRSMLLGVKLRALVTDHLGAESGAGDLGDAAPFAPGSAIMAGSAAWVLLDDRPAQRLGAALAWALRQGADELHVVADAGTGVLARRAAAFEMPVTVWHAEGRTLLPAVAEPHAASEPAPAGHDEFRSLIGDGGAEPMVEHGVLFGDVRGLEVCRVVDDAAQGVTRLEVGVGAHDREAFQMMHGDVPAVDSLARIVDEVTRHRREGAPQHPLNRLAAERFLRWRVIEDPALIGAERVEPAPPPVARDNLKDATPCVARARRSSGDAVVVFASGVDLDLIPYAADARLAEAEAGVRRGGRDGDPELVVVVPARDRVRILDEVAGLLRQPVELISLG